MFELWTPSGCDVKLSTPLSFVRSHPDVKLSTPPLLLPLSTAISVTGLLLPIPPSVNLPTYIIIIIIIVIIITTTINVMFIIHAHFSSIRHPIEYIYVYPLGWYNFFSRGDSGLNLWHVRLLGQNCRLSCIFSRCIATHLKFYIVIARGKSAKKLIWS